MNYFEFAAKNLETWINQDQDRQKDFLVYSRGLSVTGFLSKFAHVQEIIPNTIQDLCQMEARRIIKKVQSEKVL